MKFRMFTDVCGRKIAVNVEAVWMIRVADVKLNSTSIYMGSANDEVESVVVEVSEDFDTVFSRLNTIAE